MKINFNIRDDNHTILSHVDVFIFFLYFTFQQNVPIHDGTSTVQLHHKSFKIIFYQYAESAKANITNSERGDSPATSASVPTKLHTSLPSVNNVAYRQMLLLNWLSETREQLYLHILLAVNWLKVQSMLLKCICYSWKKGCFQKSCLSWHLTLSHYFSWLWYLFFRVLCASKL